MYVEVQTGQPPTPPDQGWRWRPDQGKNCRLGSGKSSSTLQTRANLSMFWVLFPLPVGSDSDGAQLCSTRAGGARWQSR